MAIKNFIQQVQQAAKGRPKSTEWYRDKIKEFGTPKTLDLIRDGKQARSPFGGRLNMFVYAPKFARKLPYYDTFPLVLPLENYSDGFLGINLHYLPIYSQPYYQSIKKYPKLKNTEAYYKSVMSIPVFPGVQNKSLTLVSKTLRKLISTNL